MSAVRLRAYWRTHRSPEGLFPAPTLSELAHSLMSPDLADEQQRSGPRITHVMTADNLRAISSL